MTIMLQKKRVFLKVISNPSFFYPKKQVKIAKKYIHPANND